MKYLVNTEEAIEDIADAVREVTGTTDRLTVKTIPSVLLNGGGGGGGGGSRQNYSVTVPYTDWNPDLVSYSFMKLPHSIFEDVVTHFNSNYSVLIFFEEYTGEYPPYTRNDMYVWYVTQLFPNSKYQYASSSSNTIYNETGILTIGIDKYEYDDLISRGSEYYDMSHFAQGSKAQMFYDASVF